MEGLLYLEGGGKAVSSLAWPWRCGHNAGSNGAHFNCPAHPSPLPSLVQLGRGHPDPFLSPLSLLSHFHFLSLHTPHFCRTLGNPQVRHNSAVAIGNAVRSYGPKALERVLPVLRWAGPAECFE